MELARVAPGFVEMAHRILWATVATVDPEGRPRTRITADCRSSWITDDAGRTEVWRRFAEGPEPVGYDPAIIPVWADGPASDRFAGLRARALEGPDPTGLGDVAGGHRRPAHLVGMRQKFPFRHVAQEADRPFGNC